MGGLVQVSEKKVCSRTLIQVLLPFQLYMRLYVIHSIIMLYHDIPSGKLTVGELEN